MTSPSCATRSFTSHTVEACDDPASFFAGCLRHCFDGIGTDDACLIRLFVYRCEVGGGL